MKVMGMAGLRDYNREARLGRNYCASCGKRMKYHYSGHCVKCRRHGFD